MPDNVLATNNLHQCNGILGNWIEFCCALNGSGQTVTFRITFQTQLFAIKCNVRQNKEQKIYAKNSGNGYNSQVKCQSTSSAHFNFAHIFLFAQFFRGQTYCAMNYFPLFSMCLCSWLASLMGVCQSDCSSLFLFHASPGTHIQFVPSALFRNGSDIFRLY